MLEQVKKQTVHGSGKRTLAAVAALLLGIAVTVWTAMLDIFPANGPWRPMKNPDVYRLQSAVQDSGLQRSVYMQMEELSLYTTGYELGEGSGAMAICLASRDGFWFPVLTDAAIYEQMDSYGMMNGHQGNYRWMKNRALEREIVDTLQAEYGFSESEFLSIVLEPAPVRSLWQEDLLFLLAGLSLELLGLWMLLGRAELRFSPAWKSLAVYGPPAGVVASLEAELSRSQAAYPLFTENWMIVRQPWKGTVFIPFGDVVWCHKTVIVRASAITGCSIVLYLKSRLRPLKWEMPSEAHANAVLQQVLFHSPQMDTRYLPMWERLWKQNRTPFLANPPCRRP